MKTKLFRIIASAIVTAGVFAVSVSSASAVVGTGAASLSVTPASGSYQKDATFSVTVKETSSVGVAGVQADLRYDTSKLQCLGIDGSTSAFIQAYPSSCGSGTVTIARTTQGTTVTGTQTIASVQFKVLADSGTTSLVFAGTSDILDGALASVCNSTCADGAGAASFTLKPVPVAAPVQQQTMTQTTTPKDKTTTNTAAPRQTAAGSTTNETLAEQTNTTEQGTNEKANSQEVIAPAADQHSKGISWYWVLGAVIVASVVTANFPRIAPSLEKTGLLKYVAPGRKAQKKQVKKLAKKSAAKKPVRRSTK